MQQILERHALHRSLLRGEPERRELVLAGGASLGEPGEAEVDVAANDVTDLTRQQRLGQTRVARDLLAQQPDDLADDLVAIHGVGEVLQPRPRSRRHRTTVIDHNEVL